MIYTRPPRNATPKQYLQGRVTPKEAKDVAFDDDEEPDTEDLDDVELVGDDALCPDDEEDDEDECRPFFMALFSVETEFKKQHR